MRKTKGIFKRGRIYWITYTGIDGLQKWESSKSAEKKDAEYLLACRRKEVSEGTAPLIPAKRMNATFSDLATKYDAFVQNQRAYKTKKNFIDNLVREFGSIKLQNFSLSLLEAYQSRRLAEGRKPATVNRYLATVKHMFTKAADWEMIPEETFKRVRRVKLSPENNRRLRYLSIEEASRLVNVAESHLKPILITALNTGMRRGEILGLRWDQVDLKHGFILLDKTKSGKRREIPINQTLLETFRMMIAVRRLDIPFVFFDSRSSKPFLSVKRAFGTACRRANLFDFHFHDLRHTFASQLVMNGVDITTISKLLGHTSLTMTLRYSHLSPNHLRSAVNVLSFNNRESG
jgi:Site-specific recombinase XerD